MAILLVLLALFGFVLGGSSTGSSGTARQFKPVCSNRMTSTGDSGLCRHVRVSVTATATATARGSARAKARACTSVRIKGAAGQTTQTRSCRYVPVKP